MWFSCLIYVLLIVWQFHWVKQWGKNQEGRLWWDTDNCNNFCDLHWELISRNNWHPGTSGITTSPEKPRGIHSHARHGSKTIPIFLSDDGAGSWSLLPSSVSLLSCGTGQPEIPIPVSLKWQVRSEKADNHLIVIKSFSPKISTISSKETHCFYPWIWLCISQRQI